MQDGRPAGQGRQSGGNRRRLRELAFENFDAASYASKSTVEVDLRRPLSTLGRKLRFVDPRGRINLCWLALQAMVLLYNAWVIPLRWVFPDVQTDENWHLWMAADYFGDLIYLADVLV